VKELNSKFETAVGQTRGGQTGFRLSPSTNQRCNPPELKGKQQYALKRWKLYVIFNEFVCMTKIITRDCKKVGNE